MHRKFRLQRFGWRLVFDYANHVCPDRVRTFRSGNLKVLGGQRMAQMNGLPRSIRSRVMWAIHQTFAILRYQMAPRKNRFYWQRFEIRGQDDVCPSSWRDRPNLTL